MVYKSSSIAGGSGGGGGGSGTVTGPSSSTNGDIAIFSGTTGTIIADSGVNINSLPIVTPFSEIPTGTINSSNVTFTLAHTPAVSAGVQVVLDGVTQYNGTDFSVTGNTITFVTAPTTGSSIYAFYNTQSSSVGSSTPQALTPGTTVSWNMANGTNATLSPGQSFTLSNPTNLTAGDSGMLTITQPGGGHWLITWGSSYRFAGGTKFVLSTTASAIDEIAWYSPDGTHMDMVGQAAFA